VSGGTASRRSSRSPIVCGVDRSPNARSAARLAVRLAQRLGHPLELVHVVEPGSRHAPAAGTAAAQAGVHEGLDMDGVEVRLRSGSVVGSLAEAGRRAALLVLGSRGEGASRRAPFGSVTAGLTGRPPCPTVVVPVTAGEELPGRVIVCEVRDERDALAAHQAGRLARGLGQTLILTNVVATAAEHDAALHRLRRTARAVSSSLSCSVEARVLHGSPGPQLARLAAAERPSILAVGATEQGPLAAALAGAPACHLVRNAERPVIVYPRSRPARRPPRHGSPTRAIGAFAWQSGG
jgi:nucleotide-binding universal stress UspA family protein